MNDPLPEAVDDPAVEALDRAEAHLAPADPDSVEQPAPAHGAAASRALRTAREYAVLAVAAIVLASLVRAFLGQAYWIPSPSMYPTLKEGDRVIVSRIGMRLSDPDRGDIVVFQNPGFVDTGRKDPVSKGVRSLLEVVGIGQPKTKYYIKRVIGVPGDRLQVKEDHVWINGSQLAEPWLGSTVRTLWQPGGDDGMKYGGEEFTLKPDEYFMMGDNREQSRDSRYFGPILRKRMVGRAFVRIWPVGRFGGL